MGEFASIIQRSGPWSHKERRDNLPGARLEVQERECTKVTVFRATRRFQLRAVVVDNHAVVKGYFLGHVVTANGLSLVVNNVEPFWRKFEDSLHVDNGTSVIIGKRVLVDKILRVSLIQGFRIQRPLGLVT